MRGSTVDVGVDDADGVALLGECHGEVRRDRRLADAALARCDEEAPRARLRVGERDRPSLRVPVSGLRARGRRGVAVQQLPQSGSFLVGHHREVETDRRHVISVRTAESTRFVITARRGPATVSGEHLHIAADDVDVPPPSSTIERLLRSGPAAAPRAPGGVGITGSSGRFAAG
jgi:hypothetical protein